MRARITQRFVEKVDLPESGRTEFWDETLPGFILRVTKNSRSFYAGYRTPDGTTRRMLLGKHPFMDAADARKAALATLKSVKADGHDPAAEKRAAAHKRRIDASETVAAAFDRFVETTEHKTKKSAAEIERLIRKNALPVLGEIPIRAVTSADIRRARDWKASTGALVTTNRTFASVGAFFKWALDEELIDSNPCAGVRRALARETARDRVLSDQELAAVWRAAAQLDQVDCGYVKTLILTGQRASEVRTIARTDIDWNDNVWSLAAASTKTSAATLIPLADLAAQTLTSVPEIANDAGEPCNFIFTKTGAGPMHAQQSLKNKIDDLIGDEITEPWRVHDLRRTVRTGLARLGTSADVGELIMNHALPGSKVKAVYDRWSYLPEKRRALDAWAEHVAALANA